MRFEALVLVSFMNLTAGTILVRSLMNFLICRGTPRQEPWMRGVVVRRCQLKVNLREDLSCGVYRRKHTASRACQRKAE
ncbi:hypothetical protein V8E53_006927 [Lactarius tabidus]